MKSHDELRAEMKAKRNKRANVLKEVKRLLKEFCPDDKMLKEAFA